MENTTEFKIREILGKVIDNQDLINAMNTEDDLSTAGLSSLSYIKAINCIEKEFDFEFEIKELDVNRFKNLKELISYVDSKKKVS